MSNNQRNVVRIYERSISLSLIEKLYFYEWEKISFSLKLFPASVVLTSPVLNATTDEDVNS